MQVEKAKYSQMMAFTKLSNQVYGEDDFDKDSWSRIRQSYQGPDRHLLVTKSDAPIMPVAICAFLGSITLPDCAFCPEGKVYNTFSGCQWDDIFLSENATLTKSDGKVSKTSELLRETKLNPVEQVKTSIDGYFSSSFDKVNKNVQVLNLSENVILANLKIGTMLNSN